MAIENQFFGVTSSGEKIYRYKLSNTNGVEVEVISLGCCITSIKVPDKHGEFTDVTPGLETVAEYEKNECYLGAIMGRVTNRIHKAQFSLNGETYHLVKNHGENHIHGGIKNFSKSVWEGTVEGNQLHLTYVSRDGEENYPGELTVRVTYELNDDNELVLDLEGNTTKPTIVNLTSHVYFNLAGHKHGDVLDHTIHVNAEKFTLKDEEEGGVPTGEIGSVSGTLLDLRKPVRIGDRIHDVPGGCGYDHNYCLSSSGTKQFAARLEHEESGRVLEVFTTQPGLQFYTGYNVNASGKDGADYKRYSSLALEPQNYPDAINHANFPNCVLKPGDTYRETCWFKFSTKS